MMVLKCYTEYVSKFGKPSRVHKIGKCQFTFQFQRREITKNVKKYHKIAPISHASKVMLKILQARFQKYVNPEPLDIQAGFRKYTGTRDKLPKSSGS